MASLDDQHRLAKVFDQSQELIRRARVAVEDTQLRRADRQSRGQRRADDLSRRQRPREPREPSQIDSTTEAILHERLDSPSTP